MKHLIIVIFIVALIGCAKDDGAIPDNVSIEDVPAVTTNLDSGGTAANIGFANQGAFEGKIKVDLYLAGSTPPAKVDVVVRKNGLASKVKLCKVDVTPFPAFLAKKATAV